MSKVAHYIAEAIERSGKSQVLISKQIGFENPNVLTMIKQGRTKLPLDRIRAFSDTLAVDGYELLDLTMREYHPDAWETIRKTLSRTDQNRWAPRCAPAPEARLSTPDSNACDTAERKSQHVGRQAQPPEMLAEMGTPPG